MISSEFEQFVLGESAQEAPFAPSAHYDPDGDCIEFIASNESFRAERLDSLVTVYIGRGTRRVVGSLIKGVSVFVRETIAKHPGFAIEIQDGRIRLHHLFSIRLWDLTGDVHATCRLTYRELRDEAEKAKAETPFALAA